MQSSCSRFHQTDMLYVNRSSPKNSVWEWQLEFRCFQDICFKSNKMKCLTTTFIILEKFAEHVVSKPVKLSFNLAVKQKCTQRFISLLEVTKSMIAEYCYCCNLKSYNLVFNVLFKFCR